MIRFLLVLFAVIVFVLLAAQWLIHSHQAQWAYGAFAAWAASFIVGDAVVYVNRQRA